MDIPNTDRIIVRRLAEEVAQIAADPVQRRNAAEWKRLNALQPGRPLVWINEIPWHEMDVDGELTPQCEHALCRGLEGSLRRTLYQWRHMPGDMVVEGICYSPLAITDTGFGIDEKARYLGQDDRSSIRSREFEPQISEEKDIEKIRMPEVSHDAAQSEERFQTLTDLLGDIMPVRKQGIVHQWFAPWDNLIRWWGVQQAMMDLVLKPDLVHQAMDRLVTAYLVRLNQWKDMNLLSVSSGCHRVGSGGLGCTDELPQPDCDPTRARPVDLWGCATAQIFSDVSPDMHMEFALQYERRWLDQWGLTYYGCCEPLHNKIDVLATVPNLRKISMSPWVNADKMVERAGQRYVLSHKPNPAVLATDTWNPAQARRNLMEVLEKTQGCAVEVILKDISTVRYEPQRLWEWARIAREVTEMPR